MRSGRFSPEEETAALNVIRTFNGRHHAYLEYLQALGQGATEVQAPLRIVPEGDGLVGERVIFGGRAIIHRAGRSKADVEFAANNIETARLAHSLTHPQPRQRMATDFKPQIGQSLQAARVAVA